jgi:trk system potassium uptake protein TrkH
MELAYTNERLEKFITAAILGACAAAAVSFALLLGFDRATLPLTLLYLIQVAALFIFISEEFFRMVVAHSASRYAREHFFAFSLIALLLIVLAVAPRFGENTRTVRHYAVGIYLLIQIVGKITKFAADRTAKGKNPAKVILASFVILIALGTIFLMFPKCTAGGDISFVDAFFTAVSATCLTGLTVQDTGTYFTGRGHLVILCLFQMGALGIIVFGAIFALMIRQAWNASERAAIRDMLCMEARSRLGKLLVFVFAFSAIIESLGALCLMNTWSPEKLNGHGTFFVSVFHSVSAFCNAGFSLFSDSLGSCRHSAGLYLVVCPLIILGGLGFTVLYDVTRLIADRTRHAFCRKFRPTSHILQRPPKRMHLQSRVVLIVSTILIICGAIGLLLFENILPVQSVDPAGISSGSAPQRSFGLLDALFQSITARTAGFNTVDIGSLSAPSLFILTLLMLIGGSPGSAAGGIKTIAVAILVMSAYTTLLKRSEVEISNRSVPLVAVGRAITIVLLFLLALFAVTLLLCITERHSSFTMSQLFFEAASALASAGLSTGITSSLTIAGKLLIILSMIIGRLGPLTLLTSLTLNMKPARYSYPEEPIMVG